MINSGEFECLAGNVSVLLADGEWTGVGCWVFGCV